MKEEMSNIKINDESGSNLEAVSNIDRIRVAGSECVQSLY
jgi:hypothetical protein